ncbi:MAG: hypothetical protein K2G13_07075, partial [Muribaculaceae bacterium]|nr:hypothetical protein [Muribaculaceae bacterium]
LRIIPYPHAEAWGFDTTAALRAVIVSDSATGSFNTVEVDAHYYKQMEINGRRAIVLCFYSLCAYRYDIKPFIQSIPEKRSSWYEGMSKLKLTQSFRKNKKEGSVISGFPLLLMLEILK